MADQIIVGFSERTTGFASYFSKLIKLVEGTPFSHAYIRFRSDTYDRDLVYQASGLKVNFLEWNRFLQDEAVYREFAIPVTAETKQAVIQFAIDNVGLPYSLKDLLGLTYVRIWALLGRRVKNPVSDGGRAYVCVELTAAIVQQYLSSNKTFDPSSTGLGDLYVIMAAIAANS